MCPELPLVRRMLPAIGGGSCGSPARPSLFDFEDPSEEAFWTRKRRLGTRIGSVVSAVAAPWCRFVVGLSGGDSGIGVRVEEWQDNGEKWGRNGWREKWLRD
nr:hypothetical protein [Tanacetum cinerariifolium]